MDVTGILFSLFCYINAVSGQNATSNVTGGRAAVAAAPAAAAAAAEVAPRTSVSVSKPDCALNCPAVKCLFPVTPQGQCCPVCLPASHCVELCTGDSSCPYQLKCCSNDCLLPETFIVKPGECPVPTGPGHCAEMCFGDTSCLGPMKCCSNGCGKVCMIPKRKGKDCVVDGKRYKDGAAFKDRCNTCICNNGNVACTLIACPLKKPGKCPEPTTPGICILGCSSDWSCPHTQKCCSNGCGLVCTLPIGAISTQRLCDGVFCPEVYCDDQVIPPGKCCNECPATPPTF